MKRTIRSISFVLLALVLARHTSAQVVEPVFDWNDAPAETPDVGDWRPVLSAAPYFETWDWWFWTDEGEFIYLQYVISTLGFGIERQGSVRATVILPGGVSVGGGEANVHRGRRGFEWDEGDWSFEPEGFRVDFEECTIGGDGTTFDLRWYDRTTKFEVTMTAQAPLFQPGDGLIELGWDRSLKFALDVLPRFAFEGRLSTRRTTSAPETWRDVTGVGYAEHTRTNGLPVMIGTEWLAFRALRPDGLTILYDDIVVSDTHGGRRLPWVLVLLDGETIFYSNDVYVSQTEIRPEERAPSVYPVPYAYEVVARSGEDFVVLNVFNSNLVQQDNILSRVSRLVRAVLSSMMNPMDYDFTADYDALLQISGVTSSVAGRGWSTVNFPR